MKNPYFDFFKKRSGQGDLDAKYELALIYEEEGESFDAFSLMYDLAQSNEERKIRTGDHKNGVYWDGYKRVKGMPKAKHRLAYYYENGIGTEVDIEKAIFWYSLAFQDGYENAKKDLERLKRL